MLKNINFRKATLFQNTDFMLDYQSKRRAENLVCGYVTTLESYGIYFTKPGSFPGVIGNMLHTGRKRPERHQGKRPLHIGRQKA